MKPEICTPNDIQSALFELSGQGLYEWTYFVESETQKINVDIFKKSSGNVAIIGRCDRCDMKSCAMLKNEILKLLV